MLKITHIAKKDRTCRCCGATIKAGEQYRQFRTSAETSWEACHAGRYPIRHMCAKCVDAKNTVAA